MNTEPLNLDLFRFAYTPENTQGKLVIPNWFCWTIERPWVEWDHLGGKPFESCIPDGVYDLLPYTRNKNGERCFAMVNPDLGVYFTREDVPKDAAGEPTARFKTLVHGRANYVEDVLGCAAVGEKRTIHRHRHEQMVTNSGATMTELVKRVGWIEGHTLTIKNAGGAVQTAARRQMLDEEIQP